MDVARATEDDWRAVRALLVDAALPLDGAEKAFATGVVAREGERLVGAAAIEPYDGSALLRSVNLTIRRTSDGAAGSHACHIGSCRPSERRLQFVAQRVATSVGPSL